MENLNVAICMDIISNASRNHAVCVRRISARHGVECAEVLDVLCDLSLARVVIAAATDVPGFLTLSLGPAAIQAIFLFALNCDSDGSPPAFSSCGGDLAIVPVERGARLPDVRNGRAL